MKLTQEEQEMLEGKQGKATKKAMEILVALGEIFGAKRLVPVTSVQVSGVSYANLGEAGLEYLEEIAKDGRVKVYTTLNPAGMDTENWKALGISPEFAEKQKKVIEAFAKMGIQTTCTCTPYFVGNRPKKGDHISWGESSAVTFANSVLGAKTNREGGPSALAAALTGRTPEYNLHLDENRQAQVLVEVKTEMKDETYFGALGYLIGKMLGDKIPLVTGIKEASEDQLKALAAALPSYGGASLFHIEGITPNETTRPSEKTEFGEQDFEQAKKEMFDECEVDFVLLGCPHCSLEELEKIAGLLKGKKVKKEFWVAVARPIKKEAEGKGFVKTIEEAGAKFACDTCHVVAPLKGRFKCVATNSAKGVFYGRGKNDFKMKLMTLEECIEEATR
jgi:predicted aconitase